MTTNVAGSQRVDEVRCGRCRWRRWGRDIGVIGWRTQRRRWRKRIAASLGQFSPLGECVRGERDGERGEQLEVLDGFKRQAAARHVAGMASLSAAWWRRTGGRQRLVGRQAQITSAANEMSWDWREGQPGSKTGWNVLQR